MYYLSGIRKQNHLLIKKLLVHQLFLFVSNYILCQMLQ